MLRSVFEVFSLFSQNPTIESQGKLLPIKANETSIITQTITENVTSSVNIISTTSVSQTNTLTMTVNYITTATLTSCSIATDYETVTVTDSLSTTLTDIHLVSTTATSNVTITHYVSYTNTTTVNTCTFVVIEEPHRIGFENVAEMRGPSTSFNKVSLQCQECSVENRSNAGVTYNSLPNLKANDLSPMITFLNSFIYPTELVSYANLVQIYNGDAEKYNSINDEFNVKNEAYNVLLKSAYEARAAVNEAYRNFLNEQENFSNLNVEFTRLWPNGTNQDAKSVKTVSNAASVDLEAELSDFEIELAESCYALRILLADFNLASTKAQALTQQVFMAKQQLDQMLMQVLSAQYAANNALNNAFVAISM